MKKTGILSLPVLGLAVLVIFTFLTGDKTAASSLTMVSDTISASAPSVPANHTINFTTATDIPALGKIEISFDAGQFSVPAALNYQDVDVLINSVQKNLSQAPAADQDLSVNAISGNNGKIVLTTSNLIASGSEISVIIGGNASYQSVGSNAISNPAGLGSYKIYIKTYGAADALVDQANAMIAVIAPVGMNAETFRAAPVCGDGVCGTGEDCHVCQSDCGTCPIPPGGNVIIPQAVPGPTVFYQYQDVSSYKLVLPDNYWTSPAQFTVTPVSRDITASVFPIPSGMSIVGDHSYLVIGQDKNGFYFNNLLKTSVVTLHYTDAQIKNFKEDSIKAYYFKNPSEGWKEVLDQVRNISDKTVSGTTQSLGIYVLAGILKEGEATIPKFPIKPKPKPGQPGAACQIADFNCDGKVDLVDLSILMYNWGVPKNKATDMSRDGKVDLIDLNILYYHWTG